MSPLAPDEKGQQNSGDPQEAARKKPRRTGQACVRCRSRKIKCDGKLPHCSPCENAKIQCKTTDRTSNRTVPRGYLEDLEAKLTEQNHLQSRIQELEARLRELEQSTKLYPRSNPSQQFLTPPETTAAKLRSSNYLSIGLDTHNQSHNPHYQNYLDHHSPESGPVYPLVGDQDNNTDPGLFETGDAGKGWYLGAASGMIYMNSIKNTASSVLGIELDLSELSPISKSVSGKSMPSLLSELHAHRSRRPIKPLLPPRDLGIDLVNDFFATINILCPILHRPSFYRELNLCYDDPPYTPSSAFIVQYNMVMAIAARVRPNYQSHHPGPAPSHYAGSRQPSRISHDQFYNRMLPYFPDLLHEPALSDLQALLLLMMYLIGVYKMGHLWHLMRIISGVAFELGLHRSDANWSNFNHLEREMRKRVFFLTVGLDLKVSNSLGRPPSFRLQDSDVSLPAYMDDEYIDETASRPMPEGHMPQLAPALQLAKLIQINSSITEKLFSVSRGRDHRARYVDAVLGLEKELQEWKDQAPNYINFDVAASPDKSPIWIANAGLFLMYHEMRLLIRHPSMGRLSPSPSFFAESLPICAEASRNILAIINRFRDFRQLECHPQSVSTIILASLTILYSLWEKKNETTREEIGREMALPLDILNEIGQTYGPTKKLHQALAKLVAATIENLERSRHGASIHPMTVNSPPRSVVLPPMQLPVRIDPSLQFDERTSEESLLRPLPTVENDALIQASTNRTVPSLRWQQDPVNGQSQMQQESHTFPGAMTPGTPGHSPNLDDPLLWGPPPDWTGGWDDFLNAIAM